MKYCDDYAALLDLFVDGELSPDEMADVQAHLDACPGCRAYVDDALALRAAFPDAEDTEVPAGFAEGVMSAIRAQSQAAPKKGKLSHLLAPLAACCAIVLLIRGVGFPGGSKAESASPAAGTEAPMEVESMLEEPAAQTEEDGQSVCATAQTDGLEAAKNAAAEDLSRSSSPYFAILTLPADALETALLADRAPTGEEDGQQRYELSSGDYATLLDQLDAAGIQPIAREQTGAESETALVIVTGP